MQDFVRRKSHERLLSKRLHAICLFFCGYTPTHSEGLLFRYCDPTDNARPELDLKYFEDICPEKNGMSKCDNTNLD
jgi:hypothetical protein